MRTLLTGSGFSVDLGDEWLVSEGWADASLQRLHGVYLRHDAGPRCVLAGTAAQCRVLSPSYGHCSARRTGDQHPTTRLSSTMPRKWLGLIEPLRTTAPEVPRRS